MGPRDPGRLQQQTYDLLVVGGGIYGAFTAWDAARRGLRVALLEKADFGGATSANSLKVIHGGLRYMQEFNFALVERMIAERAAWLRLAPDLVRPLPFVLPTTRKPTRSRLLLGGALVVNNLLTRRHNRRLPGAQQIPDGGLVGRERLRTALGWLPSEATGGARWWDAQVVDTARLLIRVVSAAAAAGAVVVNYVAAEALLLEDRRVTGVTAQDRISGHRFPVRARLVVNCAGAWAGRLLADGLNRPVQPPPPLSVALNLVTRPLPLQWGVGLTSPLEAAGTPPVNLPRTFFLAPWQGRTLIGTLHLPWDGPPDTFAVTPALLDAFLAGVNAAYPPARLTPTDVDHVHVGFLPLSRPAPPQGEPPLLRQSEIRDHAVTDGVEGLISLFGVKYTMARMGAAAAVNLVQKKLGQPVLAGDTERLVLPRRDRVTMTALLAENETWGEPLPGGHGCRGIDVIYAARREMGLTLADVVRRRLPWGDTGQPAEPFLSACADLLAAEHGWDDAWRRAELQTAVESYADHRPVAPAQGVAP